MSVSVPEKTLEHWLSIHLNYRYRAKASLWWPVSGEDISVADLPSVPGKQFWLEAKTVTWLPRKNFHSLRINLWQLWKYGSSAHNTAQVPDYYVFPIPPFNGHITDPGLAWLGGRGKSWFGYESKVDGDWFARWTWVIPGAELRARLASELVAWGANGSSKKKTFEIATIDSGRVTWKKQLLGVDHLRWHDFLDLTDTCGKPGWGSLLAAPRYSPASRSRSSIKRTFLNLQARDKALAEGNMNPDPDAKRALTYWVPGVGDDYLSIDEGSQVLWQDDIDTSRDEPVAFRSLVTLRYDAVKD